MRRPLVVEWQESSRAIADVQDALADALPHWYCRLTGADERLRQWAKARRLAADYIEDAWEANVRGEHEPWMRLTGARR